MHTHGEPTEFTESILLLASSEPKICGPVESALIAMGASVEVVLTAEAAEKCMIADTSPSLVLLDEKLPGMSMEQLLCSVRSQRSGKQMPILMLTESITDTWLTYWTEGIIDDLIPRTIDATFCQMRVKAALRTAQQHRELETLRDSVLLAAQMDRLTGVYNRETLMSMLFRETDRSQRMRTSLCMVLFDIDDFGHWNARLGTSACDDLLYQVANRASRLLRSYDLLGRVGKDEFLVALPGCEPVNAIPLADRLRQEVFRTPFQVGSESVQLSASYGIAACHGRSPTVVLREAEQALLSAKAAGPESIACFGGSKNALNTAVTFLLPSTSEEPLTW